MNKFVGVFSGEVDKDDIPYNEIPETWHNCTAQSKEVLNAWEAESIKKLENGNYSEGFIEEALDMFNALKIYSSPVRGQHMSKKEAVANIEKNAQNLIATGLYSRGVVNKMQVLFRKGQYQEVIDLAFKIDMHHRRIAAVEKRQRHMMTQPMWFSPLHTPQNWQISAKRKENKVSKDNLIELHDKQIISTETLCEELGLDIKEEMKFISIATVGSDDRPATTEDIEEIQKQLSATVNDPNLTIGSGIKKSYDEKKPDKKARRYII